MKSTENTMEKQEIKYIETSVDIEKAPDGKLTFIASKQIVDKDNDIVLIDGIDLKNFKKNPVMMFSHNHSIPAIGNWTNIRKEKIKGVPALTLRPNFASETGYDLAITMEKLVEGGYIKAVSVGLRPDWDSVEYVQSKGKKKGHRIIPKSFLQEVSFVNVGANQDALQKAVADDFITQDQLNAFDDEIIKNADGEAIKDTLEKAATTIEDLTEIVEEQNIKVMEDRETIMELQKKVEELETTKEVTYLDKLFDGFQATRTNSPNENANEVSENDIKNLLSYLEK